MRSRAWRTVGVAVSRYEPLVIRAKRADGGGAAVTAITTAFVTGYLDAAQVAAQAAALAAELPALATLTTLPHVTSGYDGSNASLAGPASVQLLRITSNPTTQSRPGFAMIGSRACCGAGAVSGRQRPSPHEPSKRGGT